jgi:hypothetical protein
MAEIYIPTEQYRAAVNAIAVRQLHALKDFQGPREKSLRLSDIKQMFREMKGVVGWPVSTASRCRSTDSLMNPCSVEQKPPMAAFFAGNYSHLELANCRLLVIIDAPAKGTRRE